MMATKKPATRAPAAPGVDKKEYRAFIGGLQLKDISVRRSATHRVARTIDMSRKVDVNINEKASFVMLDESVCDIVHAYSLYLSYEGEKTPLLTIECDFGVVYGVSKPMTDAYFGIFKTTSLPLNTWPYWREFVQSSFARMSLPPYILPVFRQA
jgi:hypothetical protein